jgi:hypothetical protein
MLMGQVQEKLMMAGSRAVTEQEVYNTAEETMSTYGFKGIDKFMKRPDQLPPPPPAQPDPQTVMAQKQLEILENESKSRIMLDAQKAQWAHEEKMTEIQLRSQADMAKEHKMASDMIDSDEDRALKRREIELKAEIEREKMAHQ